MTNNKVVRKDIFKCPKCKDGYMIVQKKKQDNSSFYGCTNFNENGDGCNNTIPIKDLI